MAKITDGYGKKFFKPLAVYDEFLPQFLWKRPIETSMLYRHQSGLNFHSSQFVSLRSVTLWFHLPIIKITTWMTKLHCAFFRAIPTSSKIHQRTLSLRLTATELKLQGSGTVPSELQHVFVFVECEQHREVILFSSPYEYAPIDSTIN